MCATRPSRYIYTYTSLCIHKYVYMYGARDGKVPERLPAGRRSHSSLLLHRALLSSYARISHRFVSPLLRLSFCPGAAPLPVCDRSRKSDRHHIRRVSAGRNGTAGAKCNFLVIFVLFLFSDSTMREKRDRNWGQNGTSKVGFFQTVPFCLALSYIM